MTFFIKIKNLMLYNNIIPNCKNANYTWGILNYTTGQWSAAVGHIQRDEVDYALSGPDIPDYFGYTVVPERSELFS